ncbi:hypothetical protein SLA2020_271680 [Shorea laevis]
MKTQLTANTSSLSIVSTNVVQVEIDMKSLLLKHKEDSVDDSQEEEVIAPGAFLVILRSLMIMGMWLWSFCNSLTLMKILLRHWRNCSRMVRIPCTLKTVLTILICK